MIKQLLDEVEQTIVICLWRADQLFAEVKDCCKIYMICYATYKLLKTCRKQHVHFKCLELLKSILIISA